MWLSHPARTQTEVYGHVWLPGFKDEMPIPDLNKLKSYLDQPLFFINGTNPYFLEVSENV